MNDLLGDVSDDDLWFAVDGDPGLYVQALREDGLVEWSHNTFQLAAVPDRVPLGRTRLLS